MELNGKFVFFENNEQARKQGTSKSPSFIVLDAVNNDPKTMGVAPITREKVATWLPVFQAKEGDEITLQVEEQEYKGEKSYRLIPSKPKFGSKFNLEFEKEKLKQETRRDCLQRAIEYAMLVNDDRIIVGTVIEVAGEFEKYVTE